MNSLSRTQKPRAGFTLLEVMVVIVILGVLASLVVPNLLVFGVLITWLCALLSINKYLRMKASTLYYI